MKAIHLVAVGSLLVLGSCGIQAKASETANALPPEFGDLPYIAGIAGNDVVYSQHVTDIVARYVEARDFEVLNAIGAHFRQTRSRLPGGTWDLDLFYRAVGRSLAGQRDRNGPCELAGKDFTREWAAVDPARPEPYIVEAAMLVAHAWCMRGNGAARDVEPEAWTQFYESLGAAHDLLSSHEDAAKLDPQYYPLMIEISSLNGYGDEVVQELLQEGSNREPYYYGTYLKAAWFAQPRWGGSAAAVDALARYAARQTREHDGAGAYARVYWWLMGCHCEIADFPIERELLAQAMTDVFERYPSDWNAANFARLACRLGEKKLASQQFARGGREFGSGWQNSYDEWQECMQFAGIQ